MLDLKVRPTVFAHGLEISGRGIGIGRDALFADDEVHAHTADFDEIAVVEANWPGDWRAIYGRLLVASAEVIAIVALINLRSHFWLEPATKADGSHGRFADDGKFVGEQIFFLVHFSAEDHQRGHAYAAGRKLRTFAH